MSKYAVAAGTTKKEITKIAPTLSKLTTVAKLVAAASTHVVAFYHARAHCRVVRGSRAGARPAPPRAQRFAVAPVG